MSISAFVFKYAILVSVVSHALTIFVAARAGMSRGKNNVKINEIGVGGPIEYIYFHRVHQNHVEQYPSFLVSLWMTSVFVSDSIAGGLGLLWLVCRLQYSFAYKPGCDFKRDVTRWTIPAYMALNIMFVLCAGKVFYAAFA
eukprot:GFYU01002580.1.p1 GENE.GFYU01002580.1~~GFYU01002580.1.p1  ORF type:complete len:141 (-),score=15.77 GFYU01002580.1:246-668(-)